MLYRTVIVPLDGSALAERALAPAVTLARREGSAVTILAVAATEVDALGIRHYLLEVARGLGVGRDDRDVRAVVAHNPAHEIVKVARSYSDALICMGSHGRSGVGEALLGSVAEGVLRASAGPVLVVGPHCRAGKMRFERLVACVDGSAMSEAILPLAASWSRAFDMKLWLTHVIEPDAAVMLAAKQGELSAGGADVVEDNYLRAMATDIRHQGVVPDWEVLHGDDPAAAIVDHAEAVQASVLALTTHGRTGLARLAIGSTAAKVVRESPCPVLLVRPLEVVQ